jgi:hypothetical protein
MPYKDPERSCAAARERMKRWWARKHVERFGLDAGDMRGRHGHHRRGPAHPRWNHGRIVSSHGYTKIRLGKGHPLADPNGYAYEHRLALVSKGERLDRNAVVHFGLTGREDTRLENLEVMSRSALAKKLNKGRLHDPKTGCFIPSAQGEAAKAAPPRPVGALLNRASQPEAPAELAVCE